MNKDLQIIGCKTGIIKKLGFINGYKWNFGFFKDNMQEYLTEEELKKEFPIFYNSIKKYMYIPEGQFIIRDIKYKGYIDGINFDDNKKVLLVTLK